MFHQANVAMGYGGLPYCGVSEVLVSAYGMPPMLAELAPMPYLWVLAVCLCQIRHEQMQELAGRAGQRRQVQADKGELIWQE